MGSVCSCLKLVIFCFEEDENDQNKTHNYKEMKEILLDLTPQPNAFIMSSGSEFEANVTTPIRNRTLEMSTITNKLPQIAKEKPVPRKPKLQVKFAEETPVVRLDKRVPSKEFIGESLLNDFPEFPMTKFSLISWDKRPSAFEILGGEKTLRNGAFMTPNISKREILERNLPIQSHEKISSEFETGNYLDEEFIASLRGEGIALIKDHYELEKLFQSLMNGEAPASFEKKAVKTTECPEEAKFKLFHKRIMNEGETGKIPLKEEILSILLCFDSSQACGSMDLGCSLKCAIEGLSNLSLYKESSSIQVFKKLAGLSGPTNKEAWDQISQAESNSEPQSKVQTIPKLAFHLNTAALKTQFFLFFYSPTFSLYFDFSFILRTKTPPFFVLDSLELPLLS